jgi:hypothetical protein
MAAISMIDATGHWNSAIRFAAIVSSPPSGLGYKSEFFTGSDEFPDNSLFIIMGASLAQAEMYVAAAG